jgi:hypothetical protein
MSPVSAMSDLDGDGRSDVLWRNASTGENYAYFMNGPGITDEGYLRSVPDQAWQVAGTGDFDGDGRADILWRNASSGENYIYLMSGITIAGESFTRTVADQQWQVAGVGDFDGDGKDDILWRHGASGENYIYFMNGLAIANEGYVRTVADSAWQIKGVGDFNGDGRADILWRNSSSGENYAYMMDGLSIASEGYLRTVPSADWQIKALADFDGDGMADIVWRNSQTGENYLYPMDGTLIKVTEGYLRTVSSAAWQIVTAGDYDGDGKGDLLWRNTATGENYLYPMDGTAIKPSEGYLRTVASPAWVPLPAGAASAPPRVGAGDLVISEIMANPIGTDALEEWFEVYNATSRTLDLRGLSVRDGAGFAFTIATSVPVPAGGYALLAGNADTLTNGGLPRVDYVYSGLTLNNSAEQLQIVNGETVIDAVSYATSTNGAARSLSLSHLNAVDNDSAGNWCAATASYGASGNSGTPKSADPACP